MQVGGLFNEQFYEGLLNGDVVLNSECLVLKKIQYLDMWKDILCGSVARLHGLSEEVYINYFELRALMSDVKYESILKNVRDGFVLLEDTLEAESKMGSVLRFIEHEYGSMKSTMEPLSVVISFVASILADGLGRELVLSRKGLYLKKEQRYMKDVLNYLKEELSNSGYLLVYDNRCVHDIWIERLIAPSVYAKISTTGVYSDLRDVGLPLEICKKMIKEMFSYNLAKTDSTGWSSDNYGYYCINGQDEEGDIVTHKFNAYTSCGLLMNYEGLLTTSAALSGMVRDMRRLYRHFDINKYTEAYELIGSSVHLNDMTEFDWTHLVAKLDDLGLDLIPFFDKESIFIVGYNPKEVQNISLLRDLPVAKIERGLLFLNFYYFYEEVYLGDIDDLADACDTFNIHHKWSDLLHILVTILNSVEGQWNYIYSVDKIDYIDNENIESVSDILAKGAEFEIEIVKGPCDEEDEENTSIIKTSESQLDSFNNDEGVGVDDDDCLEIGSLDYERLMELTCYVDLENNKGNMLLSTLGDMYFEKNKLDLFKTCGYRPLSEDQSVVYAINPSEMQVYYDLIVGKSDDPERVIVDEDKVDVNWSRWCDSGEYRYCAEIIGRFAPSYVLELMRLKGISVYSDLNVYRLWKKKVNDNEFMDVVNSGALTIYVIEFGSGLLSGINREVKKRWKVINSMFLIDEVDKIYVRWGKSEDLDFYY